MIRASTSRAPCSTAPPSNVDEALVRWQQENEAGIDLSDRTPRGGKAPKTFGTATLQRPHRRALRGSGDDDDMYILKLLHLVDDKIHAPQPGLTRWSPSGRWRQGAVRRPRFGEIEVWALRPKGRPTRSRDADREDRRRGGSGEGLRGDRRSETSRTSVPESFKVLLKRFESLGLDVNLVAEEGAVDMRREERRAPA